MPIRGFPSKNVVACYNEPNTIGSVDDYDAPRNAPAKNPGGNLPNVYWHSDFFQYELAAPIYWVNINHPHVEGKLSKWGPADRYYLLDPRPTFRSEISYALPGQTLAFEHTLYNHNLGYVPLAFVAYNGKMLMPGVAVQLAGDGRNRFVAPYVTNNIVGLREVVNSSAEAMGGINVQYQVMVFRVPATEANLPLFGKQGNNVILGKGKINTSRQYLRRVGSGDTPFDIDRGPTVDINSGRTKIVTGGDAIIESGYGGSFQGPPYIAVGV